VTLSTRAKVGISLSAIAAAIGGRDGAASAYQKLRDRDRIETDDLIRDLRGYWTVLKGKYGNKPKKRSKSKK